MPNNILDCKGTFLRIFRAKIGSQGLEAKNLDNPEKSGGLVTMDTLLLTVLQSAL